MQQIEQEQIARPLNEDEDSDSSDDGSSYRDDGESSEEEEDAGAAAGKPKTKELEWDDSTLNFWVTSSKTGTHESTYAFRR